MNLIERYSNLFQIIYILGTKMAGKDIRINFSNSGRIFFEGNGVNVVIDRQDSDGILHDNLWTVKGSVEGALDAMGRPKICNVDLKDLSLEAAIIMAETEIRWLLKKR